jgi:hypothetical protein
MAGSRCYCNEGGLSKRDLSLTISRDSSLSSRLDENISGIQRLVKEGVNIADIMGYSTLLLLDEPSARNLGQYLSPSSSDGPAYEHLQFTRMALTNVQNPVEVIGCCKEDSGKKLCSASLYFLKGQPEVSTLGKVTAQFPVYIGCKSDFLKEPSELLIGEIDEIDKYLPGLAYAERENNNSIIHRVPVSGLRCLKLEECGFFGELAGTLMEKPENKIYMVEPLKAAITVSRNRLLSGYGETMMERIEEVALDKAKLGLDVLRIAIPESIQRNSDNLKAYV